MDKRLAARRGVTLMEVLLGAIIIAFVVISFSFFAPKAMKTVTHAKAKNVATNIASSQVEEVKTRPYAMVSLTPDGGYFSGANCDCNNVNFGHPNYPAIQTHIIQQPHITYTRRLCVNRATRLPDGSWSSSCPDADNASETGYRNIVSHVTWEVGNSTRSTQIQSVVSQSTGAMTVAGITVDVCAPDPTIYSPNPVCNDAFDNFVLGSTITVVDPGSGFVAVDFYNGSPITFPVPAPGTFEVRVRTYDFFPYYEGNIVVAPNASYTSGAVMRSMGLAGLSAYSSKLTGEVYVSTHPVITKVVAHTGTTPVCADATEFVEIYNPGPNDVTFDTNGPPTSAGLHIELCGVPANTCSQPNDAGNTIKVIRPGEYFLVKRNVVPVVDDRSKNWVGADHTYNNDYLPWDTAAGGVRLTLDGTVVDSVRWNGQTAGVANFPGGWVDTGPMTAGTGPSPYH